jgi:hypothetical protein
MASIILYMHSCGNEVSVHSDSSSDDVVAEVSAEAIPPRDGDEQKDIVGARIGERVMTDDQAIAYDGPDSQMIYWLSVLLQAMQSRTRMGLQEGYMSYMIIQLLITIHKRFRDAFQMRVRAIRQILLVLWSTELLWVSSSRSLALALSS